MSAGAADDGSEGDADNGEANRPQRPTSSGIRWITLHDKNLLSSRINIGKSGLYVKEKMSQDMVI